MNDPRDGRHVSLPSGVRDCWSRIGVRGDGSCPELVHHIHCRNCPVYSAGAIQLLDAEAPADYLAQWTSHFAQPEVARALQTQSVVIFRVGAEWFGLSTAYVTEVANLLPIHSLPHRPSAAVLGLANVRGELVVCLSLGHMLGLEPTAGADQKARHSGHRRLLVMRREQVRAVCPVDEVHGIHRFHPKETTEVPTTVAKATTTYSRALLSWRDRSVGVLDEELLFGAVKRSMG